MEPSSTSKVNEIIVPGTYFYVKMASFHIKSQWEGKILMKEFGFTFCFQKEIFDTLKTLQRWVVWNFEMLGRIQF